MLDDVPDVSEKHFMRPETLTIDSEDDVHSVDYGVTNFTASAELGTILPNYYTAGSGIFLGPSGDPVSDGPVSLRTTGLILGFGRRSAECRQHPIARSTRPLGYGRSSLEASSSIQIQAPGPD